MWEKIKDQLDDKGEAYLAVKVLPGSAKTELIEVMLGDVYKIAVSGVPEKGKANTELIKFLAKELKILRNRFVIISGSREKNKLIKIIK